jgi:hypothetical protein
MPHTVRAYASRSDVETILREDLHGLTSMQLISSLKHFIVLWVQHCRSWTAGVPPSFLANKMLKLSGQWSNFLEIRVSQTDFYLWLTLRGPARNLMSYLWSLVEEDAVPALVEQTAELSENDVPEDFASNGSSESLSPPNEFDSPPHRRAKIDHWTRHSDPPQTDAASSSTGPSQTHGAASSSSSGSHVSMLQRAEIFQGRNAYAEEVPLHKTKWGRCPKHSCQYALKPHLFQTGQWAGQIRLLCSQFWRTENSCRLCFESVPVPDEMWKKLPAHLRQKHQELPASFRRNALGGAR